MLSARGLFCVAAFLAGLCLLQAVQSTDTLQQQARAALSQTTGEMIVAGLEQPVEVIRDRWGIPHIYARTEHDLFFAQGFVAAQDRLWQLDLWRRIAEGKLSEILGPAGVRRDTFARLLRYRGDWNAEWQGYGRNARAIAQAFVAGINAQIDIASVRPETLPLEFQLTGTKPEHWTPEVVVGRMAGYVMTRNARTEVQRARLVARVGAAKAAELMPTNPDVALEVPSGLDLNDITENILDIASGTSESVDFTPLRNTKGAAGLLKPLFDRIGVPDSRSWRPDRGTESELSGPGLDPEAIGSNDWVVAGRLTASGKPLLANDPHRALMLPSLRYTVHLNGPGWNVIGAGEPALPGIAAGHNERIAFGFTIVGMDQQDLYVEQLDPANHDRYLYKGAWGTLRVERETIHVKGEADREIEMRFTRHGPVLYVDATRHRAYALKWVGSEPGSAGYLRSLALDTATNLQEIRAAIAGWKIPSENIVFADVEGNIGWVAAGLSPIRPKWTGLLPVPGHTGEYEWNGFLGIDALPQIVNPHSGFIATANHNILPPDYAHRLGFELGAPWRFARIVEMIEGRAKGAKFTAADFERMQHDEMSIPAVVLTRALSSAMRAPAARPLDADSDKAARLLAGWNGVLDKRSAAAALYETWQPLVIAALAEAFISANDRAASARMSVDDIFQLIEKAGGQTHPALNRWVDGSAKPAPTRRTPGSAGAPNAEGTRAMLFQVLTGPSLGEAWRQTAKRLGADDSKWSWGDVHRAAFTHPLAFSPDRQAFMNLPPVPRGGDGTTVNATGSGARQTSGASYREVMDLADWDRSEAINVPGESGQPGSPHYSDLLPIWAEGRYHPLAFSRAAVERAAIERLKLIPGPK